jgi:hypothetical protein
VYQTLISITLIIEHFVLLYDSVVPMLAKQTSSIPCTLGSREFKGTNYVAGLEHLVPESNKLCLIYPEATFCGTQPVLKWKV